MKKEEYLEKLKYVEASVDTALNELRVAEGELAFIKNRKKVVIYLKMTRQAMQVVEEFWSTLNNEIDELEGDFL